jgi:formylglycine-generating enzyme required for sulfatase activity
MYKVLLISLLALGYQTVSAQLVTESFGSGANAFSMEFVTIGNPNNVADTTGSPNPVGSVGYVYNLGMYEVSRDQIDKANSAGSLGITMSDMSGYGSYGGNGANRPGTGISWYEAATYVNWLNTSTGGTAAYKFSGSTFQLWSAGDAGYNANNMFRNSLAKYVIASSNEWYKGAYGKADGSWSNFPNGSDSAPTAVAGGTDANTAVYGQSFFAGPADITSAGGLSAYGTMGQGGNVWEWNETAYDGTNDTDYENRELRGGAWNDNSNNLDAASSRSYGNPAVESYFGLGFRVASVPEPSALSLLVIGLGGLALVRRRRS